MNQLKLKYILDLVSNIGARAGSDREALARAQEAIRREIQRTGQEYGRMERLLLNMGRVGSASAERQAAYLARLAMRYHDVRRAAEGAVNMMGKAAQVGAGAAAGAYAADRITKAPMDYSMRLAQMANTAFAERDAAGRIQGKAALDAAIRTAVRTGGGKIDDAAGTLDSLIASGAVSREQAIKMLPMLMRASTASGASAEQLGSISLRGMQTFGLTGDQVPEALNMAMAAGQAGGFELRDMAKWLPQAMAMGKQSGLSGIEGMRRILGSMQASVITAGTKDEAGNNLVNLLGKINSADTAKDFKKLGYDLPGELARMRGKGVNSLDAFVSFVDEIASKDRQYMQLKKKLQQGGTTAQKAETMTAMADILQGKAVGQVVQDRQALMSLVAEMNNREYVKTVMDRTRKDTTAVGTAFSVISEETGFKKEQKDNELTMASTDAFAKVAPAMNKIFEAGTDMARQFPVLTTTVVGTTAALGVFAAALGGAGVVGLLRGGAGAAGGAAVAGGALPALAAAGGAWGAYQVGRLGMSLKGLYDASTREGVVLSAHTRAGMGAGSSSVPNVRGQGYRDPRLLALTGPAGAGVGSGGAAAIAPAMSLGSGRLDVAVRVTDDRITTSTSVAQPMPQIRINAGSTNPAGYATGGPR